MEGTWCLWQSIWFWTDVRCENWWLLTTQVMFWFMNLSHLWLNQHLIAIPLCVEGRGVSSFPKAQRVDRAAICSIGYRSRWQVQFQGSGSGYSSASAFEDLGGVCCLGILNGWSRCQLSLLMRYKVSIFNCTWWCPSFITSKLVDLIEDVIWT